MVEECQRISIIVSYTCCRLLLMCYSIPPFVGSHFSTFYDVRKIHAAPYRARWEFAGHRVLNLHRVRKVFCPFVSGVQGSKCSHTGDERVQHLGTSLSAWESWTICCLAGVFPALEGSGPELALVPLSNKQILLAPRGDTRAVIPFILQTLETMGCKSGL